MLKKDKDAVNRLAELLGFEDYEPPTDEELLAPFWMPLPLTVREVTDAIEEVGYTHVARLGHKYVFLSQHNSRHARLISEGYFEATVELPTPDEPGGTLSPAKLHGWLAAIERGSFG